ncbi:SNF2 family N-terminal domain-containing protein [Phaeosphaeria sp. MPI-PUGE-AT-0046c]|nr:SNF2 family N-terminal domain-containing protein [Phaeosphaeria sp. MPI-PUGE-AT-0046c]
MRTCLPDFIVDDFAVRPSKRRRLNSHSPIRCVIESACKYETAAQTPPRACAAAEEICESTLVCYGMISDLTVNIPPRDYGASYSSNELPMRFQPPRTIHCGHSNTPAGQLDDYGGELLMRLRTDDELKIQLLLSSAPIALSTERKPPKSVLQCLGIVIYGPRRRFSDVGDFVSQAGCYLDDPVNCDRNVPYMNPQCLFSLHEQPQMTFELFQSQQPHIADFTQASLDILSGFETSHDLDLSATPTALRTELQMHQKQALTFLLRRERGMHPNVDEHGMWLRNTSLGQPTFVNALTNEAQATPGPVWRGGLLADEMGLGKTLSIIALIASDHGHSSSSDPSSGHLSSGDFVCSTLIVLSLSLFSVWKSQLSKHVRKGKLTWVTHHGKKRFKPHGDEALPDIVFTTYQTVESEHRSSIGNRGSVFSHPWRRIVLDEAHIIRNHNTSTAQAMTALPATSRWAISGTPIQSSLLDFHGLLKFLHFSPYDDPKIFDKDISNLWRVRPADEAAETFKKLFSCFMIRQTKAILDLPSRDDKMMHIPFTYEENEHYRRIEQPIGDMLDSTIRSGSHVTVPWMTAIQQINKLRLVCNLGAFVPLPPSFSNPMSVNDSTSMMNTRYLMGGESCIQCFQPLDASIPGHGFLDTNHSQVFLSLCNNFDCADCSALLHYRSPAPCACVQVESCQIRPLAPTLSTPRLTPTGNLYPTSMESDQGNAISSKVRVLISLIRSRPQEKHVVFSSWISSLDMVGKALRYDPNNVIESVRIDGKVHPKNRGHAIQRLHEDPSIRVILITIACGTIGLDLTAASVLHLLEPQWNPSTEDQALARVHRLRQTRPVTTIRYLMKDSFEEVCILQRSCI